jgi:hypothetical protein
MEREYTLLGEFARVSSEFVMGCRGRTGVRLRWL